MGEILPDDVMEHIFSFTKSPKDLAKTSLVSKRWSNSWVSIPSTALIFDDVKPGPSLDFYNRFLQSRRRSTTSIHRLSIECSSYKAVSIHKSISTALSLRVRDLRILPPPRHHFPDTTITESMIPSLLFSASYLTNLEMTRFCCEDAGDFDITCPDLETLALRNCSIGRLDAVLALRTPKLNKLEIFCHYGGSPSPGLELQHAPKLSSFSFVYPLEGAALCTLECTFGKEMADPSECCVLKEGSRPPPPHPIPIENASHARVSAAGQYQCLEEMTIVLGKLFKSYNNLRSLEVYASFERPVHVARFASLMISNFSSIEILVLKVVDHPKSKYQDFNKVSELPLSCTPRKLKYIVVQVEGLNSELKLFRFLLCSAVNLLRMIVIWKHFEHKNADLKQFCDEICQEYPSVHFLFQFS